MQGNGWLQVFAVDGECVSDTPMKNGELCDASGIAEHLWESGVELHSGRGQWLQSKANGIESELLRQLRAEPRRMASVDGFHAVYVADSADYEGDGTAGESSFPAHLRDKKIGDVINECVPEKFHHFFCRVEDFVPDLKWWAQGLELDDEDSIGTHIWNLLPIANEICDWMPDASDEEIEALWKMIGDQCLTWVYG